MFHNHVKSWQNTKWASSDLLSSENTLWHNLVYVIYFLLSGGCLNRLNCIGNVFLCCCCFLFFKYIIKSCLLPLPICFEIHLHTFDLLLFLFWTQRIITAGKVLLGKASVFNCALINTPVEKWRSVAYRQAFPWNGCAQQRAEWAWLRGSLKQARSLIQQQNAPRRV